MGNNAIAIVAHVLTNGALAHPEIKQSTAPAVEMQERL
jgi:hypothetical protein